MGAYHCVLCCVHVKGSHARGSGDHAKLGQALHAAGAHGAVVACGGYHHLALQHLCVDINDQHMVYDACRFEST